MNAPAAPVDGDEPLRRLAQAVAGLPVCWWWPPHWPAPYTVDAVRPGGRPIDSGRSPVAVSTVEPGRASLPGGVIGAQSPLHAPPTVFGPYDRPGLDRRWHRLRLFALARHRDPWARAVTGNPFVGAAGERVAARDRTHLLHAPPEAGDDPLRIARALQQCFAAIEFDAAVAREYPGLAGDLRRWRRRQRRRATGGLRGPACSAPSDEECREGQRRDGAGRADPAARALAWVASVAFALLDGGAGPSAAVPGRPDRLARIGRALAGGALRPDALPRAIRAGWRVLARAGLVRGDWPCEALIRLDDLAFVESSAGLPPASAVRPWRGRGREAAAPGADREGARPGRRDAGDADAAAGTARSAATASDAPSSAPAAEHASARAHERGTRRYLVDEWNYLQGRRLVDHCLVHEHDLQGDDTQALHRLCAGRPALLAAVRRAFLHAPPAGWRVGQPRVDGDWLDIDAAVEEWIERRAGREGPGRVYRRREPGGRDLALALLLDMSASTDCPIPAPASARPTPAAVARPAPAEADDFPLAWGGLYEAIDHPPRAPVRRVIDVSREALLLCGAALAELGDAFAIYGFSGSGRERVDFFVAKPFAARAGPRHWAAVAAMSPRQYTRMGAAIRHACRRLREEPAARHALLIVSDGYPQDSDYGPDRRDEVYGVQDTAHALGEARAQGVATFCLTIDPAGHDYLSRMLPAGAYRVLDDVESLPVALAQATAALRARR